MTLALSIHPGHMPLTQVMRRAKDCPDDPIAQDLNRILCRTLNRNAPFLTKCAITWLFYLMVLLPGLRPVATIEFDHGAVLNLTEENDFVNWTDRWYTQGAKISYLQADNDMPHWTHGLIEELPTLGFATSAERIGYAIGQSMFTPADTHASKLLPNDRPYAGWLYGGLVLQRSGLGWGDYLSIENLELNLGIIGPDAFARQVQTWYHEHTPPGWSNQLNDEPGIAVKYGRAWLISFPPQEEHSFDLIPQGGLSVGNVDTSFRAGATLRVGWHLPDDIGPQPIDSLFSTGGGRSASGTARRWGAYVFSGVEGRAVLYSAFLDGNAFRESQSVEKEPFFGEWRSGIVLVLNRVEVAFTEIFRTREFAQQPEGQAFGSFLVQCRF